MKKFLNEFKEFAMRGNVVDLAVGVIIGGAFKGITDSLVTNIISPIIGLFTKQNFDSLTVDFWGISLKYGLFITSVINFIIMAFVIFVMVKALNKLSAIGKKQEEVIEEATTKECPYCFTEIDIKATRCPNCTSELEK